MILLPGVVLPAELAYGALLEALGDDVDAFAKDLELYADDEPPPGYGLDAEIDGVLRLADARGFDRFHLVGYSGGGAAAVAFADSHPERLLSLALLEAAWIGNEGLSEAHRRAAAEVERIAELPPDQMLPRFIQAALAPGVEPPPPPGGPSPPWMAKRPAGIRALTDAFRRRAIDPEAQRALGIPVYFALGGRSNPDFYGEIARRAEALFADCTVEVFAERHHFDPPHRTEPERLARSLRALWDRAAGAR